MQVAPVVLRTHRWPGALGPLARSGHLGELAQLTDTARLGLLTQCTFCRRRGHIEHGTDLVQGHLPIAERPDQVGHLVGLLGHMDVGPGRGGTHPEAFDGPGLERGGALVAERLAPGHLAQADEDPPLGRRHLGEVLLETGGELLLGLGRHRSDQVGRCRSR